MCFLQLLIYFLPVGFRQYSYSIWRNYTHILAFCYNPAFTLQLYKHEQDKQGVIVIDGRCGSYRAEIVNHRV